MHIVEVAEKSMTNVLYFCSAGKDRTGVLSALLLSRAGASRQEIVFDYMQSADNLKDSLNKYVLAHPEVDIEIITPKEDYIYELLDYLEL